MPSGNIHDRENNDDDQDDYARDFQDRPHEYESIEEVDSESHLKDGE